MKRLTAIALLCCLCCAPAWAEEQPVQLAMMQGIVGASGGTVACSTPAGDIWYEGWESTVTACGTAPCWTDTGTVDKTYALPGSPPAGSCGKGFRSNSSGSTAYSTYTAASASHEFYLQMPIYIDSHSLNAWENFDYLKITDNSALAVASLWIEWNGLALNIAAGGNPGSSQIEIALDTWYTIILHVHCGGGDGSTISVNGGAAQGFTTFSTGDALNYAVGVQTASRTVDIVNSYISVDTDGSY